jgi:ACS family D-galactonate transporter-like MFS transporter
MSATAVQRNLTRSPAALIVLLSLSLVIAYVDRGNLSIAAPLIKDELGLSAAQLGILLSAFFWSYTPFQIVSGWLADRFDPSWILAAGFAVWSLATMVTGVVHGIAMLLVLRVMLGIGESVTFPAYATILSRHLPEHRRGIANAAIMTGTALGPAIGTLAGGTLIAMFGWRPVFVVLGLITLGWLVPWTVSMPRSQRSFTRAPAPRSLDIVRHRSFWGGAIGHFSINYLAYFVLTWMPFYLVREKHFSLPTMGKLAALFYVVEALFTMVTGALTDRAIRRGCSSTIARKTAMFVGHTLTAGALACWMLAGPRWFFPCVFVTFASWGIAATGIFAFPQALAGPQASGKWTGLQNCFANMAGIIAPAMTGFLLDWTGSFAVTLAAAAAVMLIGGLAWVFVVGPLEQVTFSIATAAQATVD